MLEFYVYSLAKKFMEEKTETSKTKEEVNRIYSGIDLTKRFAKEISNYENAWKWIKDRITTANFIDLHVGDYLPIYIGEYLIKMQIAGIDTYYKTTDNQLGHHIDWISQDCYPETVKWFTENNNNGTAEEAAPYLKTTLKTFLDKLVSSLPAEVQEVISSKRFLLENRYSASETLTESTAWSWKDLGKLWIPTEFEVFGSCIWGTKPYSAGQSVQYPLFANSYFNRAKGIGDGGNRSSWWLMTVCGGVSTSTCIVNRDGYAHYNACSNALRVPICFRITE